LNSHPQKIEAVDRSDNDVRAGEQTMKKTWIWAGLLAAGCSKHTPAYHASAGSLALSNDGSQVFAVDTDSSTLLIADAKDGHLLHSVKVGASPVRVLVGADGRVFVSNKGDRTVSVVDVANLKETAKIPTGVEPVGLSFTPDGKNLLVASSASLTDPTLGTLSSYDLQTLQPSWHLQVPGDAFGVAAVGSKAYVSHLKDSRLTVVDLDSHAVTGAISLNNIDDPDPVTNPNSATAGLVRDVTVSPDGKRLYAPHVWQRNGAIAIPAGSPRGYYANGGPCGVGAIVSPGLATVDATTDTALVDSFASCGPYSGSPTDQDYPPSVLFPDRNGETPLNPLQSPTVAVVDPSNSWLFVVNRDTHNLAVMPTQRRVGTGISDANVSVTLDVGEGADGVALSRDGKVAYVYAQFDHRLSLITQKAGSDAMDLQETHVTLAADTLPPALVTGRKLFFSATDPRISSPFATVACASCHSEGREDGHTWRFVDGPRRTPWLAGRHLEQTAPYHWTGVFPALTNFYNETIIRRMGGTGFESTAELDTITHYITSLPTPENPLRGRTDLADTYARGRAAFVKASCATCHTGDVMTDNQNHDVGTITANDTLESTEGPFSVPQQVTGMNTPSLLGLARGGPYLHDGSALTLRSRIDQSLSPKHDGRDHGDTSTLSAQEQDDLETYLKSL
jgi:YVTN family beta-propeller protein